MKGSMAGKRVSLSEVRELMERLGITPNYKGFYYTVYAVGACGRETGETAAGDEMAVSGGSEAL